jgi:hypothetical protein
MHGINFNATREESAIISKIVERAVIIAKEHGVAYNSNECGLDIEACHSNGTPLELQKLLDFDDANFGHDVFGIRRHLNRDNGKVGGQFLPRCARPQHATT